MLMDGGIFGIFAKIAASACMSYVRIQKKKEVTTFTKDFNA